MKQNVSQINGGVMINVHVSVKNIYVKKIVWNPSACTCENKIFSKYYG